MSLHIVQVANFYGPRSGGLRTTLQALGRGYQEAGHRFTAVVAGPENTMHDKDFGRVFEIAAPEVPGTGGYRAIIRPAAVREILDQLDPDRLEVSDRTTLHGLGRWARSRGVPSVFFAHERVDGVLSAAGVPTGVARWVADRRNACTARTFDTIVATTGFAAAEFERVGAAHVRRVPLGVDLMAHRPRGMIDPRPGPIRLLLCSRLSVEKRPELAVEALIALRAKGCDARLTVAGDGPRRASLERLAAGHPVSFLGFVTDRDELAVLQSAADVVLAPGPIETFGLAALEALAAGTPVVAHRDSALPEVIGADPAAGLAAVPTAEGFADAVRQLVAIARSRRRIAARTRAETMPWSVTVEHMLNLHGVGSDAMTATSVNRRVVS